MKKLMIAFAAVAMAACAQAATVNWQVNNIRGPEGESSAASWLVQIYTSDVTYSYDAAKAGTISTWQAGNAVKAGTTTNYRASGSGSQDNGTTVNYYAVIYDATTVANASHYIVSANVAVNAPEGGASQNLIFGAMSGTTLATNKFYGKEWQSVPEPTSAMLLLLGVAGLALRRKQK